MNSVRAKLAQPLRRGEVEDLRGLTIDEPLELDGAALPHLDFSGSTFNAPLSLRNAVFQGIAWFIDCTFNAPVNVAAATFRTRCAVREGSASVGLPPSPAPSSTASPASTGRNSAMPPFSTA